MSHIARRWIGACGVGVLPLATLVLVGTPRAEAGASRETLAYELSTTRTDGLRDVSAPDSVTPALAQDDRPLCDALAELVSNAGDRFVKYRGAQQRAAVWEGKLVVPGMDSCAVEGDRRYACVRVLQEGEAAAEAAFTEHVNRVRRCLPNHKEVGAGPRSDLRTNSAHFYERPDDPAAQVYVVKSYLGSTGQWYVATYVNAPN